MIYRETPTQGSTRSLISPYSLEKMANPPWSMLLDSLCNVGSWLTIRISIISSLDCFLTLGQVAFTWYTKLPRKSIESWQENERQFHAQFFRAEPEMCIAELSRVTQRNGETADLFISRFSKMRNRCKIHLPKTKYVKISSRGLDIKLRKKFQGMKFRDFYELVAKVTEYEELLKEESYRRKKFMGTYCQEANQEAAVAYLSAIGTFTCPLLV